MTVHYFAKIGIIEEYNIPIVIPFDETSTINKPTNGQPKETSTELQLACINLLHALEGYQLALEKTKGR